MGVTVAVTRVAANTGTGTQDITTADLGGLTPKAVLLIVTRAVTDGTAADGAGWYMGASDGANEWTQGYEEQHAQASMNAEYEQDTTANRILTIYNGAASDTVEGTANFDSFITDGVRIDWTDAPAGAFLITAIFFAGSDLTANVGTFDLGNSADAAIDVNTVGFEADVVITALTEDGSAQGATWSMGVIHNDRAGAVTQRAVTHVQRDAFGTSQTGVQMRDGECIARLIQSSQAIDWHGAAGSFDSSGFTIQLGNARSPNNTNISWVALRLGSSPVVDAKVYTYSTPTGTGSHTDSTPNFEPQFVMYLPNRAAAADTSETDADGGTVGLLAVDADDLYTNSISSEDAAADSNTQSLSDNILNLPTHTGASGHQATLTSMGATGPVWNYSATDGTARLWPALAIGVFEDAEEGITGTASITEGADTLVAAGAVAIAGTAAITEGPDTLSASGTVSITGTASITEAPDTLNASGAVAIAGTSGSTENPDTVSCGGAVAIGCAGAITEDPDTLNASGTVPITGTASITEGADTLNGAGAVAIIGNASITENADTLNGSGILGEVIDGSSGISEGADTISASGQVLVSGTGGNSEAGDTTGGSGGVGVGGTSGIAEGDDTLSTLGAVAIAGTSTLTDTDTLSAVGAVSITGTALITEGADALSGQGTTVGYTPTASIFFPAREVIEVAGRYPLKVKRSTIPVDVHRRR
jgi:hypothetical protein